ncbi:MAG: T9SS type A sorting domain-containing protein, partial [Ferruginibacter sp.]
IAQYEVQRSNDGNNFSTFALVDPDGNNSGTYDYNFLDQRPARGSNYYRVRGLKMDASEIFSAIVKVEPGKDPVTGKSNNETIVKAAVAEKQSNEKSKITVFPNPVINRQLNLKFINQANGTYNIELVNGRGQIVFSTNVTVYGKLQSETVPMNANIVPGAYQLKIKSAVDTISILQLIIQ